MRREEKREAKMTRTHEQGASRAETHLVSLSHNIKSHKMLINKSVVGLLLLFVLHISGEEARPENTECEREEAAVEECAQQFLFYRNVTMPSTSQQVVSFCSANKVQEECLRTHSKKCLSHAAHQAISELINTMAKQNRAICAGLASRTRYARVGECVNKQELQSKKDCYENLIEDIHGIHQHSQSSKIPIICCAFHRFVRCSTTMAKTCPADQVRTMRRLLINYAGETLNYVCRDYTNATISTICGSTTSISGPINEERPKSFFSVLVKIYLS